MKEKMKVCLCFLLLLVLALRSSHAEDVPPEPAYRGHFRSSRQRQRAAKQVGHWSPTEKNNPWEMSDLTEGDIMEPDEHGRRNALEDEGKYWKNGIVPYYIEKGSFSESYKKRIISSMNEIQKHTCIKFRPYKKGDATYITIKAEESGCWSYVGRISNSKQRGQQVNLQPPNCLKRGTIMHELLHALGFHHQHSASDRDRYIKIAWENIKPGKKRDFERKKSTKNFNLGYDYNSIMHYSTYANSRNNKPTIIPLDKNARIGQRVGLSKKDIMKLSKMYRCKLKNAVSQRRTSRKWISRNNQNQHNSFRIYTTNNEPNNVQKIRRTWRSRDRYYKYQH